METARCVCMYMCVCPCTQPQDLPRDEPVTQKAAKVADKVAGAVGAPAGPNKTKAGESEGMTTHPNGLPPLTPVHKAGAAALARQRAQGIV